MTKYRDMGRLLPGMHSITHEKSQRLRTEPPHSINAVYKKNPSIIQEEDNLLMDEMDDEDYQVVQIW